MWVPVLWGIFGPTKTLKVQSNPSKDLRRRPSGHPVLQYGHEDKVTVAGPRVPGTLTKTGLIGEFLTNFRRPKIISF